MLLLWLTCVLAAESVLDLATRRIQAGQPSEAARLLAAEAPRTTDPRVWNLLGIAEGEQRRFGEAERAFRKAIELDASFVPAYDNLGKLLLGLRRFEAALDVYEAALKIAPENAGLLNAAATAAEARHDLDRAVSLLVRARKIAPKDVPTLVHFGLVCLRRGLNDDALSALRKARELSPNHRVAMFLEASAQAAVGDLETAYLGFTNYLQTTPADPEAHYRAGWLALKTGHEEQARKHLERALELRPDHVKARYELALMFHSAGDIEQAEAELRKVLAARPDHAGALAAIGRHRGAARRCGCCRAPLPAEHFGRSPGSGAALQTLAHARQKEGPLWRGSRTGYRREVGIGRQTTQTRAAGHCMA